MSSQRYPEEFKTEAVKQILDYGHSVADKLCHWFEMPR